MPLGDSGLGVPETWPSLPWDAKAFAVFVASTRCRRLTGPVRHPGDRAGLGGILGAHHAL